MTGNELVITFLGTGSAIPPNNRQQSSFCIRHAGGLILFDCGEGTQYAMRKYSVSTRKEVVISISHLHSDHFLGLPGLLSSFQLLGREDPITIIGPLGIKQTVHNLMVANYIGIKYPLEVHELNPGEKFVGNGYELSAIKSLHEANAVSYIWQEDAIPGKVDKAKLDELGVPSGPLIGRLQRGEDISIDNRVIRSEEVVGEVRRGRCIIYTGDTAKNLELASLNIEVDLLVHEATYPSDMVGLARERSHTTVRQAAEIAKELQPKKLILTHISPRIMDFHKELSIARNVFKQTSFAEDGFIYKIPYLY